jgi:phosphatidylserine/phosphatidylglycerophosphate/cardiolipin synthase-like enzyme
MGFGATMRISWVRAFLVSWAVVAAGAGTVRANDTPIDWIIGADNILGLDHDIQNDLQAANEGFDQLFLSAEDIEDELRWLIAPETEEENNEKYALDAYLADIRAKQDSQVQFQKQLSTSLLASPASWSTTFDQSRMAGFRVPEIYPLYVGPSISTSKPFRPEVAIGSLGTGVREYCLYEENQSADGLGFFMNDHLPNTSCILKPASAKLISDPTDALCEKIELLTGMLHSDAVAVVTQADPRTKLDFSKAPKLDAILMGYLEFKNDFSGQMMAQAMKYHAAQGAKIRLIVPDSPVPGTSFIKPADRKLIDELTASSPNIQFDAFRSFEENPDLTTLLAYLQREYHAKAMVTLSSTEPERSGVIVGGRNIKDTFYFRNTPDFSAFPDMVQYGDGQGQESYVYFQDLEVSLRGYEVASQVAAEIMSFWNRDMYGPKMPKVSSVNPITFDATTRAALRKTAAGGDFARFFFSVPYMDSHMLEQTYISMIASAKKKIRIVNPYVTPPSNVGRALTDAAARGVDIDFVSDYSFVGDNSPSFTGDINKIYFNSMVQKIHVYNWSTTPRSILHAKAMLIDDDVLYVGSANFDHRTFQQDVENGMLLTGAVIPQFKDIFDNQFVKNSQLIKDKEKVGFLSRLLKPVLDGLGVD